MQIKNSERLVEFVFREFNCLVKPLHPDLGNPSICGAEKLSIDKRLVKMTA